jgi:hypothetical protein
MTPKQFVGDKEQCRKHHNLKAFRQARFRKQVQNQRSEE